MSINEDRSQRVCGELSVGSPLIGGKVIICADNCDDFTKLVNECAHKAKDIVSSRFKDFTKILSKIPILSKIKRKYFMK